MAASTFAPGDPDFLLDGERFVIRAGEMHYARIPREYWQHRLRMAHAMGLNTISTYVFWNVHEPKPGQFDFSGNADIAEYCRLAQKEGLKVIIRPGPYCCAEWDLGGLPWWLLQDPTIKVRTRHPGYLEASRRYFKALGQQLVPLQVSKGGPIILVQVENEYDGQGADKRYISALHDYLKEAGFDVPCFMTDMPWSLKKAEHGDLLRAVDFGAEPDRMLQQLRAIQPQGPLMCGELYTGWFDYWGRRSAGSGIPSTNLLNSVSWMLEHRVSFSLYMIHGGTSFGFRSGANCPHYEAQPTSYDYGAPISEAGWDTPKFYALRALLTKHLTSSDTLPVIPQRNPVIQVPAMEVNEVAPVSANLPQPRKEARPKAMELFDQPHGCILYRTKLPAGGGEQLVIRELHDYGWVLMDGKKIATLDRSKRKQPPVILPARTNEVTLDLLVEAMGRVNYGDYLQDRKGITEKVQLIQGGSVRDLIGWEVFNLPLFDSDLAKLKFQKGQTNLPAFYRGVFNLAEVGDTFLDLRKWGKGVVWINGHNLGRYWSIGPQQTLYCPGPWLKKGRNELIVLELNGAKQHTIAGLTEPILNELNLEKPAKSHRQPAQTLQLGSVQPFHTGVFGRGKEWQSAKFEPVRGRYFCLESLISHTSDEFATCAELELLGDDGKELSREKWKILYADSEELAGEDGNAENILDGDPHTFWHTQWDVAKPKPPHQVVIDLGREETITGLRYMPRQDSANGQIRDFRLYFSTVPFQGL